MSATPPPGASVSITSVSPAPSGGIVALNHPTVSGRAPPLSTVSISVNGTVVGTTIADVSGGWSYTIPAQLNGAYTVIASAAPTSPKTSFTITDPNQPMVSYLGVAAVFDYYNSGSIFYSNGVSYGSSAALFTALSATTSGNTALVGPFLDPTTTNIISNGTFDTVTTGWTTFNGATIAIVSGEMQYTGAAALDGFSQAITGYTSRVFKFVGTGRRGTSTTSFQISATTQNAAFGSAPGSSASISSTSNATTFVFISTAAGTNTWYGARNTSGVSGAGTALFDNFTAVEAMPLPGWTSFSAGLSTATAPSFSVAIEATTPASAGSGKVIWQGDANTERDRVRLIWQTDGHVHFIVTSNNSSVIDFDLGTIAPSTAFKVSFANSNAGAVSDNTTGFAVSINGANCQAAFQNKTLPGISHMRIGQDATGGSLWDGTYGRVTVLKGRAPTDWLEAQSAPSTLIWTEGDSYMAGAGGPVFSDKLETATGRVCVTSAVGGSSFGPNQGATTDIVTRVTGRSYLRDKALVIWDGSANGMVDVTSQVALMQTIVTWKGDTKYLIIPSIPVPNPGVASSATIVAYTTMLQQYTTALVSTFGAAHVFDAMPTLQALSTGSADDLNDVAAGLVPRSAMLTQNAGEVHLSGTALDAVANAASLLSKIAAL